MKVGDFSSALQFGAKSPAADRSFPATNSASAHLQ
jgi:hypothetical protein